MLAALWCAVAGSWRPVEASKVCDPSDSPWGAASLAAAHKEKGHRSGSGGTGHKPEDALDALPPHAKTASACLPVAEAGIAIWIAAPPGAGKSSTAYRLRRYGFLAVDGEDQGLWAAYCERATPGRCDRPDVAGLAINATLAALHDGVALAMGAAGLSRHSFNAAPANVMKVILLPDRATNTARWLARQDAMPGYTDLQAHDAVYDETKNLLATNGERFVAVKDPATDNCVDASLIRLCNGVLKRLVTPPKADARTAQAELCFYCTRASPQWALYPYCRSRCNAP